MNHKPFESWLVADEPLMPDQEFDLQEHLKSCESCRRLQSSWQEVEGLFGELLIEQPQPGFTERWQVRLAEEISREKERQQLQSSWVFLASTTGTAFVILVIMSIRFFTTVQTPTQVFVSGMALIAGLLNLTAAIQGAVVPLLEVFFVSVPTQWWLFLVVGAFVLTFVLTFSTLRFLSSRRVSL